MIFKSVIRAFNFLTNQQLQQTMKLIFKVKKNKKTVKWQKLVEFIFKRNNIYKYISCTYIY
jgi:hypothetical protein